MAGDALRTVVIETLANGHGELFDDVCCDVMMALGDADEPLPRREEVRECLDALVGEGVAAEMAGGRYALAAPATRRAPPGDLGRLDHATRSWRLNRLHPLRDEQVDALRRMRLRRCVQPWEAPQAERRLQAIERVIALVRGNGGERG